MNQQKNRHIVIVGGGFGGIAVARELRKSDARVTLIDKNIRADKQSYTRYCLL